jgi:hypothetical protein
MKYILSLFAILITIIISSCSSTYNASTDYRIKSILTITEKGDTVAVPVRDFKFRILDRRIQELIDRDPYRYQYRQNWQGWNYNLYPLPNINNRSNYNRPNINIKPGSKPVNPPPILVKPYRPSTPINIKPIVKPNKKNN